MAIAWGEVMRFSLMHYVHTSILDKIYYYLTFFLALKTCNSYLGYQVCTKLCKHPTPNLTVHSRTCQPHRNIDVDHNNSDSASTLPAIWNFLIWEEMGILFDIQTALRKVISLCSTMDSFVSSTIVFSWCLGISIVYVEGLRSTVHCWAWIWASALILLQIL